MSPLALSASHVAPLLHPGVLGAVVLVASHYGVSRVTAGVARERPRARVLRPLERRPGPGSARACGRQGDACGRQGGRSGGVAGYHMGLAVAGRLVGNDLV